MLVMGLVPFHRNSVLQVDPMIFVKIRIQGDADEPGLAARIRFQVDQLDQLSGLVGRKKFHLTRTFGDENSTV